jgi:cobalt-zinc-cadmium efflux system membrane fusion protein
MKTIIKSIAAVLFLSSVIALSSCKEGGKKQVEAMSEESHSEAIEISEEQMETVGIELGTVEIKNLNSAVKASGEMALLPQNKADVTSLSAGVIKQITVIEGSPVKKGQTVALLENLEIVKLQEAYLAQKQELAFSRQEYERQQELSSQNAGTGKVFQQVTSKYETDKARLTGLETQLRQLNIDPQAAAVGKFVTQIPIVAPINGVVGEIHIKTGSYADMQTPLMEITDNSQIQCNVQVFEKDFSKVKAGQQVEIALTNMGKKSITGKVYSINQSFENDSKSITVHVKVNNPDGEKLLPGMYVSALINVGNQLVKAVPVNAVAHAEGKQFIFLFTGIEEGCNDPNCKEECDDDGKVFQFKKVEVITGTSELGYVEVTPLETIPENAEIISKGAFYIMSKISSGEDDDD